MLKEVEMKRNSLVKQPPSPDPQQGQYNVSLVTMVTLRV